MNRGHKPFSPAWHQRQEEVGEFITQSYVVNRGGAEHSAAIGKGIEMPPEEAPGSAPLYEQYQHNRLGLRQMKSERAR